ncbi:MAG: hypothetical protein ACI9WU_001686, partial [Myxococcota bacterium]
SDRKCHRMFCPMMPRLTILVSVLVALTLTACGLDVEEAPALASIQPQCQSSGQCTAGTVCDTALQICVAADTPPMELALVPTPPAWSQQVAPHNPVLITYQPGQDVAIQLPQVVRLRGRVQVSGNYAESSIPSIITAVAKQDLIPSAAVVQHTTTTSEGFELLLQASVPYEIRIAIDGADRPLWKSEITLDGDTDRTFELPPIDAYPVVRGEVRTDTGNGMTKPLGGVQVTAVDVETNRQCTANVTNQGGEYTLRCPIDSTAYRILVSPTDDGPVAPSFTALMYGSDVLDLTHNASLPEIVVPGDLKAVQATIQLTGDGLDSTADSADGLASGIPVIVSTAMPDIEGVWTSAFVRAIGVTDPSGSVTVSVLACADCQYTVTALPHPNHALATARHDGWVIDNTAELTLGLAPKVILRGEVLAFNGTLLANARVEARRIAVDAATQTTTQLTYSTETTESGGYALPVDPGSYDLTITPAEGSGLPQHQSGPHVVGAEGLSLETSLAATTVLQGTVIEADRGDPVDQVTVDVYRIVEEGPPQFVGSGQSGTNGRYLVILPSELK